MLVFKKGSARNPLLDEHGNQSKWSICTKVYYHNDKKATLLPEDVIYNFINRQATIELNKLGIPFSFAKPTSLIKYLIKITGIKDAVILDFFVGSGTTAHAVMSINAEDGHNHKYICVQLDETIKSGMSRYKTVYKIARKRIIRAARIVQIENPKAKGDFGFKEFRVE